MPAAIVGDNDDGARPRDIRAFTAEAHGWEVLYRRGDLPNANPCFVDHGREIRIHDLQSDSVLAALQLSAQKWGTIQVHGSDNYKRLCVDLAVEQGFRITNPELQEALANERSARLAQPRDRSRDVGDLSATRPPVRDVGEAYRRHLEDVGCGTQHRDIEASRVDALIAVRLRATGYSRDQVEHGIRIEAPLNVLHPRGRRALDG